MADDPYIYPGTDTLRNLLGITDDGILAEAERRLTLARGVTAERQGFPATADGYRALHKHLFQDVYEWAGKDRTIDTGEGDARFAHAAYIANGLDAAFRDMGARNGFRGLSREDFFDRLGEHINELNAVHPFREGNGRTIRRHAAQVSGEAGHPIRIASIDKAAWTEASRHGFLTGDHRGVTAVLAAAAIRRDLAPEARIGPAGVALLPLRDPPAGQRYRMTLRKVREELDRYLPMARQQAADRLRGLVKEGAPINAIANARTELAYVQHAKGPVYQAHLLASLGVRKVDAVITPQQTPLERVREIGAALGIQINAQQPAPLQRAVRALERPASPPGGSPAQERLAATFLNNTAEKNNADPRLAPAQAIVEAAVNKARDRGESARTADMIGESTRRLVADRIRTGGALDAEIGRTPERGAPEAPLVKDRGR